MYNMLLKSHIIQPFLFYNSFPDDNYIWNMGNSTSHKFSFRGGTYLSVYLFLCLHMSHLKLKVAEEDIS